jgi:hypothetical protein
VQDPESLYRQAQSRLRELHAAADRRSMVRRARGPGTRNRRDSLARIPRLLKRLLGTRLTFANRRAEGGLRD